MDECELFNFMKPVASSVGFWCFEEWGEPGIGIPVFRYPPKLGAAKRSARCPEADHVPEATTPALLSCARGVSR